MSNRYPETINSRGTFSVDIEILTFGWRTILFEINHRKKNYRQVEVSKAIFLFFLSNSSILRIGTNVWIESDRYIL